MGQLCANKVVPCQGRRKIVDIVIDCAFNPEKMALIRSALNEAGAKAGAEDRS